LLDMTDISVEESTPPKNRDRCRNDDADHGRIGAAASHRARIWASVS
jgi:hypothetical protein